jgi:hypothetical protein
LIPVIVNGDSGFVPENYFEIRDEIGNAFPNAAMIKRLRESQVTFVIVLRSIFSDTTRTEKWTEPGVELVLSTPAGVDVFEIKDAVADDRPVP